MADVKDIAQLFIQLGDGDDVTNLYSGQAQPDT